MRFIAILILVTGIQQAFGQTTLRGARSGSSSSSSSSGGQEVTVRVEVDGGNDRYGRQQDRRARGPLQGSGNTFETEVVACGNADMASASACAAPEQLARAIEGIGSSMNSSNPKTACLQMEILYATAATLEMIWANKCKAAAAMCVQRCSSIATTLGNFITRCNPHRNPYNQWKSKRERYEECMMEPPRIGPAPGPPGSTRWVYPDEFCRPRYVPQNYPSGDSLCFGNLQELTCQVGNFGYENCFDSNVPQQRTDVSERVGACTNDGAKSLAAMMEAGMMGYAAVLNELCRRKSSNDPSGSPTGPGPSGPLDNECKTKEQRKTNSNCMPFFCTEFLENQEKPECSCELDMFYASPRCNCKHKADKTNPACKAPTGPTGNVPFTPPPRTPIPTPPPVGGTRPTPTPVPNSRPTPTLNEDIDGGIDQEYNPAGGPGGPGQKVSDPGAGGGGGISSLGLGAGGGGNGAPTGEGPYNTDINKGYGNSGGGGFGGGGGGYPGGPQGGGYGPEGEKDKMDFGAFLPKVDKERGLAGGDPENGITGANGLSNWEKVTRKMNEKRPVLLP